jgi:four helix bundle protein
MQDFRQLKVWQRSHQLTLAVYRATAAFPKHELYGLTSQIRRSSSSIPANISEGCGREGGADLARFLQVAMGSACELEYHLLLASDLGLLPEKEYKRFASDVVEIKRMLASLIRKLRQSKNKVERRSAN